MVNAPAQEAACLHHVALLQLPEMTSVIVIAQSAFLMKYAAGLLASPAGQCANTPLCLQGVAALETSCRNMLSLCRAALWT